MKVALELQKQLSIAFYPDLYIFMCFLIAQVYLRSAASSPFRKHAKSSKFVCIKSSLQCMHNLYPFYRNSKMS